MTNKTFTILQSPEGDWFEVRQGDETILEGHRPTLGDIKDLLEFLGVNDGNPVEIDYEYDEF